MGIACGQIRKWDGGGVMSESTDTGVGRCCGVVALIMRRVKLGVDGGQDASRRGAAGHAKFSKWDRDVMLQLSTAWVGNEVGSERPLISR